MLPAKDFWLAPQSDERDQQATELFLATC